MSDIGLTRTRLVSRVFLTSLLTANAIYVCSKPGCFAVADHFAKQEKVPQTNPGFGKN